MAALPIIVVHRNDCDYLKHCLAQARLSNPDSPIYLIGSGITERFEGVTFVNIREYMVSAWALQLVYRHMNDTGLAWERLVLQRWFVVREFLIRKKMDNCLCIDSDVLLYADIGEEQKRLAEFDLAVSKRAGAHSPHCCYINGLRGLLEFCKYVMRQYVDPRELAKLKRWYDDYHNGGHPGGVGDMMLLRHFEDTNRIKMGDLAVIEDWATYDHNINGEDGFEMADGIKRIEWIDGLPYGRLKSSQERVRFNALHFQGNTKPLMGQFVRPRSPRTDET